MKVEITQQSLFQYLAEVDPVLRRLEALTQQLTEARKVLNAARVSGEQITTLIESCDSAVDLLPEITHALVDAKGHLIGAVEQDVTPRRATQ